MRALIVEDNIEVAECIAQALQDMGLAVDSFARAALGWHALQSAEYDLIVLDLNLPDRDGLSLLKQARGCGNATPLLIVSARTGIDERAAGLDLADDDYLVKPFSLHELEARVRALLRRSREARLNRIEYAGLGFDQQSREFYAGDQPLALPPRERSVLEILIRQAGKVMPKESIYARIFNFDDEASPACIELYIHRLRRKLDKFGIVIETQRGRGYRLARR